MKKLMKTLAMMLAIALTLTCPIVANDDEDNSEENNERKAPFTRMLSFSAYVKEKSAQIIKLALEQEYESNGINYRYNEYGFPEPIVENEVTISFTGDCLVSTYKGGTKQGSFNWCVDNYGVEYFLDNVRSIFEDDDITVVNCETALSDRNLSPRNKPENPAYWYIGPTRNAKVLSCSSVEVASIANNHSRDYGDAGTEDTIKALEAEGMSVLKNNVPIYIEKNGIIFGILGCGLWYDGADSAITPILNEMTKKSDFQIIYPHGGKERIHEPETWKRNACKRLIDAGADLIVMNHPHVLQPMEEYKGKTIIYSLGNFCFGDEAHAENRTAIYQCTIKQDVNTREITYTGKIIPCYVYTGSSNNWQPALIDETDENYQHIIDFMNWKRKSPV